MGPCLFLRCLWPLHLRPGDVAAAQPIRISAGQAASSYRKTYGRKTRPAFVPVDRRLARAVRRQKDSESVSNGSLAADCAPVGAACRKGFRRLRGSWNVSSQLRHPPEIPFPIAPESRLAAHFWHLTLQPARERHSVLISCTTHDRPCSAESWIAWRMNARPRTSRPLNRCYAVSKGSQVKELCRLMAGPMIRPAV